MSKNFKEFSAKYKLFDNILYENKNWVVSIRPEQKTPFSMILTIKKDVFQIRNLSKSEFLDLQDCYMFIKKLVFDKLNAFKINYLCLMLIDSIVHFHVFPRFNKPFITNGFKLIDNYYPKPVDLSDNKKIDFNMIKKSLETF